MSKAQQQAGGDSRRRNTQLQRRERARDRHNPSAGTSMACIDAGKSSCAIGAKWPASRARRPAMPVPAGA
ncbi:hypothetical protein, partial [Sphingobium yanoikuyae]|uniref:hypothetical protein n=1 Tax=Sphingobium yanoikuyae TaxID=13690 RepID=UPI00345ED8BB